MRLTKKLIVESYKKTGLKPCQGKTFPTKDTCCPLAAIAAAKGRKRKKILRKCLSDLTSIPPHIVSAFLNGVDFYSMGINDYDPSLRLQAAKAYCLGQKIGHLIEDGKLLKRA